MTNAWLTFFLLAAFNLALVWRVRKRGRLDAIYVVVWWLAVQFVLFPLGPVLRSLLR